MFNILLRNKQQIPSAGDIEARFWLNLQNHYDMELALDALQGRLDVEVRPFSRASCPLIFVLQTRDVRIDIDGVIC